MSKKLSVWKVVGLLSVLTAAAFFAAACSNDSPKDDRQAKDEEKKQAVNPTPTKEEKLAEFLEFYKALEEERKKETRAVLKETLLNGKHEELSLVLQLTGIDAFKKVLDSAREISAEITFVDTLQGAMEVAEVKDPKDLPGFVKVLPDGSVRIPGQEIGITFPPSIGWLTKDYVITDGTAHRSFCTKTNPERMSMVLAKFTLRPTAEEAKWKEEVLFDDSVAKLCAGEEVYPRYDGQSNTSLLKRPKIKFFPIPEEETFKIGKADRLKPGGLLVFATLREGGLRASYGILESVRRLEGTNIAALGFSGIPTISPNEGDEGAPVYYISRDEKNPVKLIGFITDAKIVPAVAMPAEQYLLGIKEFQYIAE